MFKKGTERSLNQDCISVVPEEIRPESFSYKKVGDLLIELEDLGYIRQVTPDEDPEGLVILRGWSVKGEEKVPFDQLNEVLNFFEDRLTEEGKEFLEKRINEGCTSKDGQNEKKGIYNNLHMEGDIISQRQEGLSLPAELKALRFLVAVRALFDPQLWHIFLEGRRETAETNALIQEMKNTEHALRGVRSLVNTTIEEVGNLTGRRYEDPKEILADLVGLPEITLENMPTAFDRLKTMVAYLEAWPTEVSDEAETKVIQSTEEKKRKFIQENSETEIIKNQTKWERRGAYIRDAFSNLFPEITVGATIGALIGAGFAVYKQEELVPWMRNVAVLGACGGWVVAYAPAAIARIRGVWGRKNKAQLA